MDILILETKRIETLELIDLETGVDWIKDFMAGSTAYSNDIRDIRDKIIRIDELGFDFFGDYDVEYATSQENFDWWKNVIEEFSEVAWLLYAHADMITPEIQVDLDKAWFNDLDAIAPAQLEILQQVLQDNQDN